MDYKDIANRLRKWANGETCEDCPAKTDLARKIANLPVREEV